MKKKEICAHTVMFKYTWPGKNVSYCCVKHAIGIMKISIAIKLHLVMIQITPNPEVLCTSMVENEQVLPVVKECGKT
jgi:hypothetical protein